MALKRPQDPTVAIDRHSVPGKHTSSFPHKSEDKSLISDRGANLSDIAAKRRMEETLRHNAERPLFEGPSVS